MKRRVNVKFVIILGTIIVGLVAGVYLFANYFLRKSSGELQAIADVYLAEGNLTRAYDNLSKARHKDQTDPDLAIRTAELGLRAPVEDVRLAWQRLGEVRAFYAEASKLRPGDEEVLERYLGAMLKLQEQLGTRPDDIYRAADAKVSLDADNLTARKYRGIAQTLMMAADTSPQERQAAADDLDAYLAQHPEDASAQKYRIRWKLKEARILASQNREPERVEALRQEAVAAAREAVEGSPQDPERLLQLVGVLLETGGGEDEDEVADLIRQAETQVLEESPSADLMLLTAELARATDRAPADAPEGGTAGQRRALALLARGVEAYPGDLRFPRAVALMQREGGDNDAALQALEEVRQKDQPQPAVTYIRNDNLRSAAAFEAANLYIEKATASSGDEREALLKQAEAIRQEQANNAGSEGLNNLLGGKIARLRGDEQQAQTLLTRAGSQLGDQSAEALYLSAEIYNAQGEWGTALSQLDRLLQIQPGHIAGRMLAAQVLLRAKRPEDAARRIEPLARLMPDNLAILQLQASIDLARNNPEAALSKLRRLSLPDNPSLLRNVVRIYVQTDRKDEALTMLQEMQQKDPANLAVVQLLAQLSESDEVRNDLLREAEAGGADQKSLDLLKMVSDPDDPMTAEKWVEQQIEGEQDPAIKTLLQASVHRQQGEMEAFRDLLTKAAKLEPADESKRKQFRRTVLDLRFADALAREAFDEAREVAREAGEAELDSAGGAFYMARVDAAAGNVDAAVGHLRGGLQQRPVYSQGHRMLGGLLLSRGDVAAAEEAFETALEQKPDDVPSLMGLVLVAERRGDVETALRRVREAVGSTNDAGVWSEYADREQRYGDPARALDARRRVARANPDNRPNRLAMAVLLAQTGERAEADQMLDELIEEFGADRSIAATRANIELATGDPAAAAQVMRDYVSALGPSAAWQDHILLGRAERAAGNGEAAIAAYQRAIAADDSSTLDATREFTQALLDTGNLEPALEQMQRLHQAMPEDDTVTLELADLLLRLQRPDDVASTLASAEFDNGDDQTRSRVIQALAMRQKGQNERAISLLERAVQENATSASLVQLASARVDQGGQLEQAETDLNRALDLDSGNSPARQLLAEVLRRRGDLRGAEAQLERLVREQPGNVPARLQLVDLYERRGNTVIAIATLRDAAERMPDSPLWPARLAELLESHDRYAEAIPLRERVFESAPGPQTLVGVVQAQLAADQGRAALALLDRQSEMVEQFPTLKAMRARALVATGQRDQGLIAFREAAGASENLATYQDVANLLAEAIGPRDTVAEVQATEPSNTMWRDLVIARLQATTGDAAAAVERLLPLGDRAGADENIRVNYLQTLALAHQQAGQFEQARKVYTALVEENPQNMVVLNNLAYLLSESLGRHGEALPLAERAAAIAPREPLVLDTLGWIQHQAGRSEEARRALEQSVEIRSLAANTYHLGVVYSDVGELEEARTILERAVRLAEAEGDGEIRDKAQRRLDSLATPGEER